MSSWREKILLSKKKRETETPIKRRGSESDRLRDFLKALQSRFPDVDTQVDELQSAVKDQRKLSSFFTALSNRKPGTPSLPLSLSLSNLHTHPYPDTTRVHARKRIADREQSMLSPQMNGVLERARRNMFHRRRRSSNTPRVVKVRRAREQWRASHNKKVVQ